MKTYNNLYEKICSLENLRKAYKKARKGKSKRHYVIFFESDLQNNLLNLQKELIGLTYHPGPLKTFVIRDPKTRVISASDFRDRIVHHALCNIIEPIFDKTFIHDSYASRKNKGTHKAIERFDQFKRKITGNGRIVSNSKDNNMVVGYVLKADIKHYFDSVDHEVMLKIIERKIGDKKVLWLIKKILDNHNTKTPGKGMPIGNLTSQIFANVYLNELDNFVKHKLRIKHYIRYLDDFVIFDRNKEKLQVYKKQIVTFLKTIKLELHSEKSTVIPLHKGINFLGFRIFYHHKLLKKSNLRLFRKRLVELEESYICGEISKEKLLEKINGWMEYARQGNTHKLRKNYEKFVKF
ncbi:MAG: reverse transcriptase/maturase family protein [Nanoarchaeota archaeon]|nr:reverse transcriptase/maturase family protein [Nanoarchaeota archaeon]